MKNCIIHNWYQSKDSDGDLYWTCSGCFHRTYVKDPNIWTALDMAKHADVEEKMFEKNKYGRE